MLRQYTLTVQFSFKSVVIFGFGYFLVTMNWIVEPFLIDITAYGWLAPFALTFMAAGLSFLWGLGAAVGCSLLPKMHLGLALGIGVA